MNRQAVLDALERKNTTGKPVFGTGTSIVSQDVMAAVGSYFPDAHVNAEKMTRLAIAGHTLLGLDTVMPLFSVYHDVAALGLEINWGGPDALPEGGKPIFRKSSDIAVPSDLLKRSACAVPLESLRSLRKELGDSAAVLGKVMGPWTIAYHTFGVENFLIGTMDDPDETRRMLDKLLPVSLAFARAQVDAGADCIIWCDHATRDLCSPDAYREFLQEIHSRIVSQVPVPLVLHICGNSNDRIGLIAETGVAGFHWDTKTGAPAEVRKLAGERLSLMGGMSNFQLLRGNVDEVRQSAQDAWRGKIDIVGPECAIPLKTPLANLKAIASIRQ